MGLKKRKPKTQPNQSFRFNKGAPSSEELISFINKVMGLKPIEFAGFLKIMCVASYELEDGKPKARAIDIMISEMIDRYITVPRAQRKELHQLLSFTLESYKKEEEKEE